MKCAGSLRWQLILPDTVDRLIFFRAISDPFHLDQLQLSCAKFIYEIEWILNIFIVWFLPRLEFCFEFVCFFSVPRGDEFLWHRHTAVGDLCVMDEYCIRMANKLYCCFQFTRQMRKLTRARTNLPHSGTTFFVYFRINGMLSILVIHESRVICLLCHQAMLLREGKKCKLPIIFGAENGK